MVRENWINHRCKSVALEYIKKTCRRKSIALRNNKAKKKQKKRKRR